MMIIGISDSGQHPHEILLAGRASGQPVGDPAHPTVAHPVGGAAARLGHRRGVLRQYHHLSVLGWAGQARTVRGKFVALREEDFTQAAKYLGASEMRIIIRHMVPSFSSHLIAVLTLRVPEMILAETSLSFLGLGLRKPVTCWGALLTGVQNIRAVALAPWLFLPGVAIVVTVLAFNFVGDGLRDAADPYAQ